MILLKEPPEIFEYEPLPEYDVRPILYPVARDFVTLHHYAGGCLNNHTASYGLFDGDYMIGAIMFATPSSENVRAQVFGPEHNESIRELHRLVILDITPKNTESYFIARALRALKNDRPHLKGIVSYADPTHGHIGVIYQATNAIYYGQGKSEKFYRTPEGRQKHRRQCGRNISTEEALARGWTPFIAQPKHRYCFLLPDGSTRKAVNRNRTELFEKLLLPSLAYPKKDVSSNGFIAPL